MTLLARSLVRNRLVMTISDGDGDAGAADRELGGSRPRSRGI